MIHLIKQPNNWSCMAASAAMILNVTLQDIYEYVGHDGSAIVFPDLPDPICRKGFHSQEILDIVHCFGCSMTPIEVEPWQTSNGTNEYKIEKWGLFKDNKNRLDYYMKHFSGILEGKAKNHWHAMAWDCKTQRIYDPAGLIYSFEKCRLDTQTFWLIK